MAFSKQGSPVIATTITPVIPAGITNKVGYLQGCLDALKGHELQEEDPDYQKGFEAGLTERKDQGQAS